ncbi:MAG TPA: GGDEF domain-containing protein [Acidobacteriaceae bacterium]
MSPKLRGMRLLAWAYTLALAAILVTAGGYWHGWLAHTLSPELLLICFLLLHYTFLGFVGRKPRWQAPVIILVAGLAGFLYCSVGADHYLLRAELTAALLGTQALLSGFLLLRYAPEDIKAPSRATAIIFLLFGTRSILRCLWVAHYHVLPEQMQGTIFAIGGISAYLILNAFTPLGYMWMETTRLQREMEILSATDSLTGALNRRAFDEAGLVEVERSRRYGLEMSVIAIDVDHFKMLNDEFGHKGGDSALVRVSEVVRSMLRATDVLARVGGDEFVILLPATDQQGAHELAERVRGRIANLNIEMRGKHLPVEASFGVATLRMQRTDATPSDSWEKILEQADAALYRAKEGGRNRVG